MVFLKKISVDELLLKAYVHELNKLALSFDHDVADVEKAMLHLMK